MRPGFFLPFFRRSRFFRTGPQRPSRPAGTVSAAVPPRTPGILSHRASVSFFIGKKKTEICFVNVENPERLLYDYLCKPK